jgi:hypothetical protein
MNLEESIKQTLSESREYQLQAYKEDGTMEVSNWHSKEDFVLDLKRKVDKDESYESTMIMKRIAEMECEEDEDEIKPTLEKKYDMETKKEAVDPLEEIMSLKERTNDDTYSWQQINKAMMNAGYGATQILKLVQALKNKKINKGDMGNKDAYYWATVNQALMKDVGLSPSAIFKVLQQLNKLK